MCSTTPLPAGEVLQHVDLVWRNCRVYNTIEGSFVLEACDKAQQLFEARWAAAGLPGRPPPAVPSRKRGTPKQVLQGSTTSSALAQTHISHNTCSSSGHGTLQEVGEAVEAAASKTEQAPQQASSGRERQPSEAPREDAAKDASEATIVPGPPSSVKSKDLAAAAR